MGLAVILVVVVSASIFLVRNLSDKQEKSSVSQPVAEKQVSKETKEDTTKESSHKTTNSESIKKVVKAPVKNNHQDSVSTQCIAQEVESVTIEIPDGVQYTKKCDQKRCEILIYY